jgi:flagellar protein FlaG
MDVGKMGTHDYTIGIELQLGAMPEMPEPTASLPVTAEDAPNQKPDFEQDQTQVKLMPELDDKKLDDMLSKGFVEVNKRLAFMLKEMEYSYHKPTRSIVVKVFNSETKEVVREIPPQKALDALVKMWELAGILVDEQT